MEMDDDHTITTVEYHLSEPNKISCSFDKRYYDEIITRLRLQAIEKYQYGKSEQQSEKLQEEEKLHHGSYRSFMLVLLLLVLLVSNNTISEHLKRLRIFPKLY